MNIQKCTSNEDNRSRAKNLEIALKLESQGKKTQARQAFSKCVDITPRMAYELIKVSIRFLESSLSKIYQVLLSLKVDYIVAPYEADAQMYHLERLGIVDGIITEDSDLLVFGAKKVNVLLFSYRFSHCQGHFQTQARW